jgi:hypothetical protein
MVIAKLIEKSLKHSSPAWPAPALSNCFGILSAITSTYFMPSNFALAEAAAYIVCCVLVELGYFIGLKKSILVPCLIVPSLGFLSWDFDVVSTKMLVAPPFYPKFIWTSVLLMPDCSLFTSLGHSG